MKIAICTLGSRGDIQPFLVLGQYLKQNGHEVIVSSAEMYQHLASTYDVAYQSFNGDYAALIDDDTLKKEIGKNPFAIGKALKKKVYPIIENSLETFFELANWADVVLYHPKTMLDGIGESFQHKLIKAYVVPAFTPTSTFANPVLSFLPLPRFLNKLSYRFAEFSMNSFNKPVQHFRKKHQIRQKKNVLETPAIYGVSPSFLEQPKDYPKSAHFTGFWTEETSSGKLTSELNLFLADDSQVLLITFGSMPYKSDVDINTFISTITKHFELKVLVVKGWGLKNVSITESERVMAVESAPFHVLFPKVDFAIHHGGAGTTAIALQSGLPQLITPILYPFGDQYFWGKQIERKGIGVAPIPLKHLSTQSLVNSIEKLLSKDLVSNAKLLQQELEQEDGLFHVKEIVEQHYAQYDV